MSWSFNAIGHPQGVAEKAEGELSSYRCYEPEETIKKKVIEIIGLSCKAFPPNCVVKVEAYGSQSGYTPGDSVNVTNAMSITITPLPGFVQAPAQTPPARRDDDEYGDVGKKMQESVKPSRR
jgi:hypothetical protein